LRLEGAHSQRKNKGLFFAINLEVAIIAAFLLYIGFDYLICNIAAATAKIPACPKVAPPILMAKGPQMAAMTIAGRKAQGSRPAKRPAGLP